MIYRLLKHLLVWLLVCLPMMVLGVVVLAVVLPFLPERNERLPRALAWFDNASGRKRPYPFGDGLSGDPLYRLLRKSEGHTNRYWERLLWLGFRNPINYFDYSVLGHTFTDSARVTFSSGSSDPGMDNSQGMKVLEMVDYKDQLVFGSPPFMPISGSSLVSMPTTYYEYFYVKNYTLFGKNLCVWFRFGWKIVSQEEMVPGEMTQWVLDFNPFKPQ